MTEFKLCERAGLTVKDIQVLSTGHSHAYIRAFDVEALLANAPVVYGHADGHWDPSLGWFSSSKGHATHTARTLLIEPLVRESEEITLLREFVAACEVEDPKWRWGELRASAAMFLAKHDGGAK